MRPGLLPPAQGHEEPWPSVAQGTAQWMDMTWLLVFVVDAGVRGEWEAGGGNSGQNATRGDGGRKMALNPLSPPAERRSSMNNGCPLCGRFTVVFCCTARYSRKRAYAAHAASWRIYLPLTQPLTTTSITPAVLSVFPLRVRGWCLPAPFRAGLSNSPPGRRTG